MRVRLIGLDIDGTLLNSRKQITPRTREAVEAAARAGVHIAYVTGRPLAGTAGPIRLDGVRYIIASNGATTHDVVSGALLRGRFEPPCAVRVGFDAEQDALRFDPEPVAAPAAGAAPEPAEGKGA